MSDKPQRREVVSLPLKARFTSSQRVHLWVRLDSLRAQNPGERSYLLAGVEDRLGRPCDVLAVVADDGAGEVLTLRLPSET